jgi:hypothetical protein
MQSQEALKWCLHEEKKEKKKKFQVSQESDITLPKSVTYMEIYRDFIVYDCSI